jgi:hypothetical protein
MGQAESIVSSVYRYEFTPFPSKIGEIIFNLRGKCLPKWNTDQKTEIYIHAQMPRNYRASSQIFAAIVGSDAKASFSTDCRNVYKYQLQNSSLHCIERW